jgi:hypothetical protein
LHVQETYTKDALHIFFYDGGGTPVHVHVYTSLYHTTHSTEKNPKVNPGNYSWFSILAGENSRGVGLPYRREPKDTCVVAQADAWRAGRWQASPLPSMHRPELREGRGDACHRPALAPRRATHCRLTFALIGLAPPAGLGHDDAGGASPRPY